ncbi:hypothetical protein LINPERHAP2_LOCUS45148, partial [Linum perenne]
RNRWEKIKLFWDEGKGWLNLLAFERMLLFGEMDSIECDTEFCK